MSDIERFQDLLDAVDPEVHAEYGRSKGVIERLDGISWPQAYRMLRNELNLSGELACDLTIRFDRGELSEKDPADIGAVD